MINNVDKSSTIIKDIIKDHLERDLSKNFKNKKEIEL